MTALLESGERIVRGDLRGRVPLHSMEHVTAQGDNLEFIFRGEHVRLALGSLTARRWAAVIAAPPPTLACKLGITADSRLHVTGRIDDDSLRCALASASEAGLSDCDLAIVRTDDRAVLID